MEEGHVYSYAWLPTEIMSEDLLAKEKCLPQDLEDVLIRNDMNLHDTSINEVKALGQEVRIENIRNFRAVDSKIVSDFIVTYHAAF